MTLEAQARESVLSVVLFGSHATGEADSSSDIDLCLFVEDMPFSQLLALRHADFGPVDNPTVYPHTSLCQMARSGSLFLWHLKNEGRVLFDRAGYASNLLSSLRKFATYEHELRMYSLLLDDVDAQACTGDLSEFDMHMMHVVMRNVSILINHWHGSPKFGRESAFRRALELRSELRFAERTFRDLSKWHLAYERGYNTVQLSANRAGDCLLVCRQFIAATHDLLK